MTARRLRSFLFATLLGAALPAGAETIRKIRIEVEGDIDMPRVLDLLGLSEGEEFSAFLLDQGLMRLADSQRFEGVRGSYDPASGELRVDLALLTRMSDLDIRITGPGTYEIPDFLRSDLAEAVGVPVGDPIYLDLLGEIRDRVVNRLADRGFLTAKVVLALEARFGTRNQRLVVSVDLGPRSSIRAFLLKGFAERDIREFLKVLREQDDLQQFIDNFAVTRDFVLSVPKEILRRVPIVPKKLNPLADEDDQPSEWAKADVDIPLDWIAINQSLSRWSLSARAAGYYDFQVRTRLLEGEPLTVQVELLRGSKYRIEMEQNVAFWENELRTLVLDKTVRLGVPFSTAEAEALLRKRYRSRGYLDFSVETKVDTDGEKRTIHFIVNEGQQSFLGNIDVGGIPDSEVEAMKRSVDEWLSPMREPLHKFWFDEGLLRSQLPDLLRRIRRRGFLSARIIEMRIVPRKGTRFVDVEIPVQLGPQFSVSSVSVTGNIALTNEEMSRLVSIEPGEMADPDRVAEINQALLDRYRELGFLDAKVLTDESALLKRGLEGTTVDVDFQLEPGPQVKVGKTLVDGLGKTKERVVLRELSSDTLEAGGLWTLAGSQRLEQNLLGLGVFGTARTEASGGRILSRGDPDKGLIEVQERDLRIFVSEIPGGAIEFGPGFRTALGLIGFAELNYRNLGGWNRSLLLRTQVSRKFSNEQFIEQKFTFAYLEPFLADQRLRLRLNAAYEKSDRTVFQRDVRTSGFNVEEESFGLSVERDITDKLQLKISPFEISVPRIFDPVDTQARRYRIASFGTSLVYDSRNSLFNPSRGWLLSSSAEYAAPWLGSDGDIQYLGFRQDIGTYLPLDRVVVALLFTWNRLWGLGNSTLPQTKRLALGGEGSLRSLPARSLTISQDVIHDMQSFEAKVEYRQPIIRDLGVAIFGDSALVDAFAAGSTGLRKGLGFGFRYSTPVGPLALDFAFNIDQRVGEDDRQILFSIGAF